MNFENTKKTSIEREIREFKKNAISKPDDFLLFSEKEIEHILTSGKRIENELLENKTLNDIFEKNGNVLKTLNIDEEIFKKMQEKLVDYTFIEKPEYIKIGRYIRWVKKNNDNGQHKLNSGAPVLKMEKNTNDEIILTCKTSNIFLKIKFNDCLIFQKLSFDEKVLLCAFEHTKTIA